MHILMRQSSLLEVHTIEAVSNVSDNILHSLQRTSSLLLNLIKVEGTWLLETEGAGLLCLNT